MRVAAVTFAALALAIERFFMVKQRSRARSTFSSTDVRDLVRHLGDLGDHEELRAVEHALLAEGQVLRAREERQALEHLDDVVDRPGPHPIRVVLEASLPVLVVVDLAVAQQREETFDLLVADGAPEADAVDVVDGNEHRGLVRNHSKMVETAGGAQDGFGFDALHDSEPMIWVNDLVTNLKCHVSPTELGA